MGFIKWIGGIVGAIVAGVGVFLATEYLSDDKKPDVPEQPKETAQQCSESGHTICGRHNATCQITIDVDSRKNELCVWRQIRTEDSCKTSGGIWTTSGSTYAQRHPGVVPQGWPAICASQVQNF